jgi:lysophospholipase L1-like esterase
MNRIFLLGDSTCARKSDDKRPETGWGMTFPSLVDKRWKVVNLAMNGRSTKSFLDEGLFALCLKDLQPGDWVLIQFGHNDSKEDEERHTEPWTSFQDNLSFMADQVLARQARPLLLTPIARRRFDSQGNLIQTHGDYPWALRELAGRKGYPLLDMTEASADLLAASGPDGSKRLFLHLKPNQHPNYPDGIADDTHLNAEGALVIARIICDRLRKAIPDCPFLVVGKSMGQG